MTEEHIRIYPIYETVFGIPFYAHGVRNGVPAKFRRIHMPRPLCKEIERFIASGKSPYKTVGELCTEAGRMLIEHYELREKHG